MSYYAIKFPLASKCAREPKNEEHHTMKMKGHVFVKF